ncbi:Histone deacetylase complex subunit [Malassezia yamatoensis]|uniref:Histone deacetylase complex subunit n=1 Tax=Malassezia yamatoensis TaxID=253288 RepID=A0AAJ5YTE5_9BASI|nr:Histone deacetylase complex subunit [Malassezia yamatoensis]
METEEKGWKQESTEVAQREDQQEDEQEETYTTPRRSRRVVTDESEDADSESIKHEKSQDEEGNQDEGVTRCVCGSTDENVGLMIQCETCKCWQHCACMGMHTEDDCPDVYYCEQCKPENHITLLRSLGFLSSPKSAKRNGGRTGRSSFNARELKDAKDAIRAMAMENAARHQTDSNPESPVPHRTRANSPQSRRSSSASEMRSSGPKRRSTMNSREIGENGWESIPAELLAEEANSHQSGGDMDDPARKRKRSPRDTPVSTSQQEPTQENSLEVAKRRRTQDLAARTETRKTPQPDSKKERASLQPREEVSGKNRHPNQYTYRAKEIIAPKRDARRTRETGTRTSTPQPETNNKSGNSALPEHLQHLSYLLPKFLSETEEEKEGTEMIDTDKTNAASSSKRPDWPEPFPLMIPIDTTTKIRYPTKRMTLGEMRKRVRSIGEYVTRTQIEAVERSKRSDILRRICSEPDVGEQPVPLSIKLEEQLSNDLTTFIRRFMYDNRVEDMLDAPQ